MWHCYMMFFDIRVFMWCYWSLCAVIECYMTLINIRDFMWHGYMTFFNIRVIMWCYWSLCDVIECYMTLINIRDFMWHCYMTFFNIRDVMWRYRTLHEVVQLKRHYKMLHDVTGPGTIYFYILHSFLVMI